MIGTATVTCLHNDLWAVEVKVRETEADFSYTFTTGPHQTSEEALTAARRILTSHAEALLNCEITE